MRYELKDGLPENFVYARSTIVTYWAKFRREEDGLVNGRIDLEDKSAAYQDYEYVSAVEREAVFLPVEISMECSFESYGAPLIIFSEALNEGRDGGYIYGRHYEAVLWEKGINIWQIEPNEDGGQKTSALCRAEQPFQAGRKTKLTVRLTREGIEARADECVARAKCSLPERMYVGFTACEGINRFSWFSVEKGSCGKTAAERSAGREEQGG